MKATPSANANGMLRGYDYECCRDKNKIFENYCDYMFIRTQSMFVYDGLPDTIPATWLELYLQRNGSCAIAKVKGEYYALIGSAGGEYDEYYQPTLYTVTNPALDLSESYTIGKDCVYCRNDYLAKGLTPLISRYCGMFTENLTTLRVADINMRMTSLLSAGDDTTLQSTKLYLKELEEGRIGVIGEGAFFDGVKLQSKTNSNSNYMTQFIELHQYLKGSLYNELGLNANFNMKREALGGSEAALNDDALMPLIDDMLRARRRMCEDLSDLFGLKVKVDYGSTWHSNVLEKEFIGQTELGGSPESVSQLMDESRIDSDEVSEGVDIDGGSGTVNGGTENESDDTENNSRNSGTKLEEAINSEPEPEPEESEENHEESEEQDADVNKEDKSDESDVNKEDKSDESDED